MTADPNDELHRLQLDAARSAAKAAKRSSQLSTLALWLILIPVVIFALGVLLVLALIFF